MVFLYIFCVQLQKEQIYALLIRDDALEQVKTRKKEKGKQWISGERTIFLFSFMYLHSNNMFEWTASETNLEHYQLFHH